MTLKGDAKFEEKLTCGLENDIRNIANCHESNLKSQYWDNALTKKTNQSLTEINRAN